MALEFSYPDVSWHPDFDNHEIVLQAEDPDIGFKSFIAVHDTTFGSARGGCRYWSQYQDDNEALKDVLRLSQNMTYKNTMAGLPYGGGKTVIIGPQGTKNPSPEIMQALGHALNELDGIYQTGEDVGTRTSDFKIAGEVTEYVRTRSVESAGAVDLPGGPPLYTAYGVYAGIKAAMFHKHKTENLKDVDIAVKGLGNVAWTLCDLLHQDGANLIVTDINQDKVNRAKEKWNVKTSTPDNIIFENVDIYSPCALGGDINDQTIDKIKSGIIAGAANNQLTDVKKHAQILHEMGVIHAPDYVINAGGVINVVLVGKSHEYVMRRTENIGNTLINIFNRSKVENKNTTDIANMMVRERLEEEKSEDQTARQCA